LGKAQQEVKEYKSALHKEVKKIRDKMESLTEENEAYKKVIEEMSIFFKKISYE